MKDEQKWIHDIRSKMDNYSEPLPSAMWERVEKGLDTPKVIPMWKRWQAVAAVGLIAVVSSLTFWFWFSPAADRLERQGRQLAQQEIPVLLQENSLDLKVVEPVCATAADVQMMAAVKPKEDGRALTRPAAVPVADVAQVALCEDEEQASVDAAIESSPETGFSDPAVDKAAEARRVIRQADRERMRKNAARDSQTDGMEGRQNVQLSLAAGNTPYSSSSSFGGFGRMASRTASTSGDLLMNPISDKSTAYSQVLFNNREQIPTTDIHHRMPVTLGASVKWNLKKGWGLETGLTYTILSSESHAGSQASYMDEKWKLHYIGIPLKVHRSIWENKHFHVYASAGGAVEKSVSGNLETVYVTGTERERESTSLHVSELQWSVAAAVGAQVKFTSLIGLYVEPGIAYYFDDGSGVETFRKDHPLNFNLQMGLRFTFGK